MPSVCVSSYSPLNGGSVPFFRVTWYCSSLSSDRHSESLLRILSLIAIGYTTRLVRSSKTLGAGPGRCVHQGTHAQTQSRQSVAPRIPCDICEPRLGSRYFR